jgi:hypothetical protein
MIAEAKITEIFFVTDKFNENFEKEMSKHSLVSSSGKRRRNRKGVLSEREIRTIPVLFSLNHCRDQKSFYLHEIAIHNLFVAYQ